MCDKFDSEMAQYDLFLSKAKHSSSDFLASTVGCNAIIIVGSVGESSALFADTFNLTMFYDKFAERNVREYCKLARIEMPHQHVLERLCMAPESFNHYAPTFGYQCTCYGEYKKMHVYMVADDVRECAVVYDNYIYNNLFKNSVGVVRDIYKVFGLSNKAVNDRLDKLGKHVLRKCETNNMDTKIVLSYPPKCSRSVVEETRRKFSELFSEFLYANAEQSLAKTLVDTLNGLGKNLSVAESITGGMIASSIVDVAGASNVLYEGLVTYSIQSKCRRLEISPHFVDEYGVVSQQVAQEMATGLIKSNGTDLAIATTGFAGPTSDNGMPVGLCFIGVATPKGVSVYQYVFPGDRNSIRALATNMALFLAYKTVTK